MNWFNNLKVRRKLFFSFGIFIFLMIFLTVYSSYQLRSVNRAFGTLTEFAFRRHSNLTDAIETLAMLRINNISTAYLINDDEISQSLFILTTDEFLSMCSMFLISLNNYRENAVLDLSLSGEMLEARLILLNRIENIFIEDFETCFYKIRNGLESGDQNLVSEALEEAFYTATAITDHLNILLRMSSEHLDKEIYGLNDYSQLVIYTQIFVAVLIIALSIILALFVSKALENPVQELGNAATEIANGNLNFPIRSSSLDEIGILSNHIGDMVDALKKANEAKSTFLANMSHEMRTPLNVVVGLTDLRLEDQGMNDETKEDIKKINSAGAILLGLVNDVLDISKIEAGKLELVNVNYNTASLLNDIITLNVIRIADKKIDFVVNIDENFPYELYGDELRLKQILNNLLSNAFKYTREGTVKLEIGTSNKTGNEIFISITVSDTGIGIKEEDINKLFSDYNQVDTKANRKIEGTGLGLSITKKLTKLMDGNIKVESEYGKGTVFHVTVKQFYVNDSVLGKEITENLSSFRYTEEKQHAFSALKRIDLSGKKVLVVDDYSTNLDVASGMLKKYNLHVDCVLSGRAAIDALTDKKQVYDAVFMDHMMPEMDGIEAVRIIRSIDTEYIKNLPIIALTANALLGNEELFLSEGFNAFLSKPINLMSLDAIIKKWIARGEDYSGIKNNKGDINPIINNSETTDGIPGIDMNVKNELYSGETDIFIFALESFTGNIPEAILKMRNVSEENLHEYAIDVHALKSMAGAIGAKDISSRARELETESKAGNLTPVLELNDKLLDDVEMLRNQIMDWLEKNNKQNEG